MAKKKFIINKAIRADTMEHTIFVRLEHIDGLLTEGKNLKNQLIASKNYKIYESKKGTTTFDLYTQNIQQTIQALEELEKHLITLESHVVTSVTGVLALIKKHSDKFNLKNRGLTNSIKSALREIKTDLKREERSTKRARRGRQTVNIKRLILHFFHTPHGLMVSNENDIRQLEREHLKLNKLLDNLKEGIVSKSIDKRELTQTATDYWIEARSIFGHFDDIQINFIDQIVNLQNDLSELKDIKALSDISNLESVIDGFIEEIQRFERLQFRAIRKIEAKVNANKAIEHVGT